MAVAVGEISNDYFHWGTKLTLFLEDLHGINKTKTREERYEDYYKRLKGGYSKELPILGKVPLHFITGDAREFRFKYHEVLGNPLTVEKFVDRYEISQKYFPLLEVSPVVQFRFDYKMSECYGYVFNNHNLTEMLLYDLTFLVGTIDMSLLPKLMEYYQEIKFNDYVMSKVVFNIIIMYIYHLRQFQFQEAFRMFEIGLGYLYLPKEFPFYWLCVQETLPRILKYAPKISSISPKLSLLTSTILDAGRIQIDIPSKIPFNIETLKEFEKVCKNIPLPPSPPIDVWTASHINHPKRFIALFEMINSVLSYLPNAHFYISISSEPGMLDTTKLPNDPRLTFYHHLERKKQFDHLQYIHSEYKKNTSQILFMDDDDLMTSQPPIQEDRVTASSQIWVRNEIRYRSSIFDFSGMIVPYYLVDIYFRGRSDKLEWYSIAYDDDKPESEDVLFWREYILRLGTSDKLSFKYFPKPIITRGFSPFILHRQLYEEKIPGDWKYKFKGATEEDTQFDFASKDPMMITDRWDKYFQSNIASFIRERKIVPELESIYFIGGAINDKDGMINLSNWDNEVKLVKDKDIIVITNGPYIDINFPSFDVYYTKRFDLIRDQLTLGELLDHIWTTANEAAEFIKKFLPWNLSDPNISNEYILSDSTITSSISSGSDIKIKGNDIYVSVQS